MISDSPKSAGDLVIDEYLNFTVDGAVLVGHSGHHRPESANELTILQVPADTADVRISG